MYKFALLIDQIKRSQAYKRTAFPTSIYELICNWALAFGQVMLHQAVECMLLHCDFRSSRHFCASVKTLLGTIDVNVAGINCYGLSLIEYSYHLVMLSMGLA